MKLTFLGTCAAEGYPAVWCRCERCTVARERGGRNLRFRSAALLNDDLLLDAGPDVLAAAIRLGVDLAPVQAVLVTHPHTDHLDVSLFSWRRKGFCATPLPVLHVYGSAATLAKVAGAERSQAQLASLRLEGHRIGAFQRFEVRTGGPPAADPHYPAGGDTTPATPSRRYEVLSLRANHAEPEHEALFFALRQVAGPEVAGREERPPALLYATDTGPFDDQTWQALDGLAAAGWRFHAAIVDSTNGAGSAGTKHMNLHQMAWHQQELERRGLLAEGAPRVAHHFSHNGTPPYEELEALLRPQGLTSSYDGLALDL